MIKTRLFFCFLFIFTLNTNLPAAEKTKAVEKTENVKQVYKSVDSDGNVIFTDEPMADAEVIEVKELPTINLPLPAKTTLKAPTKPPADTGYSKFEIISPTHDESFWNVSAVNASVQLQPQLKKNHLIKIMLDGKILPGTGFSRTMANPDRGTHSLSAQIEDAKGKIVQSAKPVQFHVHKTSIQH